MQEKRRSLKELLQSLPVYDAAKVEAAYQEALQADGTKVIALDDDPTGVQTVHDVFVYTDWKPETMQAAFEDGNKISFILTNSRGMTAEESRRTHEDIATAVAQVAKSTGRPVAVLCRGDSTLRGHYPLETDVVRKTLEACGEPPVDGEIIMPFFLEGGRYTVDDVHYVAAGDELIPAAETEFARDKTFGYRSSNLCEWIEEKTGGTWLAQQVCTVTLSELRTLDYEAIEDKLLAMKGFSKMIVNAVSEEDVKVFVTALFHVLGRGKHFVYRSAAALAKVMGGVSSRGLLTRQELVGGKAAVTGIIVAGSHVNKTTTQLQALKKCEDLCFIEINQHTVVNDDAFRREMDRVVTEAENCLASGRSCAVYTRRERFDLNTGNREDELRLAVKISDAVTSVVARLNIRPDFIIAKGGITSSEIGTKALGCRKARVMGQILKGVPVWETGPESKFPGIPYVIFPGNVGNENGLLDAVQKLLY